MSKIKLTGESSGYVEISAGSNAGNNTLELPTSGTRLVASDTGNNVTVGGSLNVSGIATFGSSVGIGTDNPSVPVHVYHATNNEVARFESGDTTVYIAFRDSASQGSSTDRPLLGAKTDDLFFQTGGSEKVRIDSSGNVGVGTDNPTTKLHITGNASNAAALSDTVTDYALKFDSAITSNYFSNAICFAEGNNVNASIASFDGGSGGAQGLVFGTGPSNTERPRIASAGQIGLSGANYGTARQVLKSNGSDAAPTWSDLYSFYFYGQQDTTQTNIANATYTRINNLGSRAVNIGPTSIATWTESSGQLTIGADGAGYWFLSMGAGIDDIQDADYVQVVIGKNGGSTSLGTVISTYSRTHCSAANHIADAQVSTIVNLDVGDVVRFYVYHNEGTSDEATEHNRCFAMGYKI